jgi:hypothetical protein
VSREVSKMNIELLKAVASEKLAILALERIPENEKRILTMRLDAIISNYSQAFLADQLYWYLRTLHALRDSKIISEEQFKRLMIDYDTIVAIFS